MAISTMKGLAAVLVAGLMFAVSSAHAATPTPWVHPGTHPYEGTPQAAGALHEKAIGLPVSEFMKGVALFNAGQCEEYYLRDGEILQNTFTRGGVSRSVSTVVAFKDPKTGRTLALNDPKRRAAKCRIPGRTDGATVVFPYVCENWSVQFLPPVPVAVTPPAPPPAPVPTRERVTTYVTPEPTRVFGGQVIVVGEGDCITIVGTPTYSIGGGVSVTNRFQEGN
ncbi:MAG: hypothetical protein RL538_759 [Candidatus Parcubacteria bacterium]|jgi:hypothetical protein